MANVKYDDDSSGKRKGSDARTRSAVLSAALMMGICLGVLVSEKLYLSTQEADMPADKVAAARSRKMEISGGGGGGSAGSGGGGAALAAGGTVVRAAGRAFSGKPKSELEGILRTVAPEGEVMIVISNINLIHESSLRMWLDCVEALPAKNWLVVAIDEPLQQYCKENGINHYYKPVVIPDSQKDTGSNHAISAMKYQIIQEFLELGWDVLLSDVDIVTVQNPFDHLHRDSDVEGMSDGFEIGNAYGEIYGIEDPSMGWSRYAQGFRHMALNSGLFYVRASDRTVDLMTRIAAKLHAEKAWDQSVYNEFIFTLSHGDYTSPQVSVRVMDIFKFMNSKVLFKQVRHMPEASQPKPVMVHMNYHPNKSERMRAAIQYYLKGEKDALKRFPGGSEPGSK